ncbi:nuclear transport factor 2 family protein [Robertmurraya sp. FSL W8-0741]|uniref:nuclear transport factor 2 family protein n=1 Tax=Robertmurraya sp. FSL W8-0741 TaxID=2954629 RepID=UPI0030F657D5
MSAEQKKLESSYKEIAVSFLQLVAAGKVRTAYEQYISANFTHHNPYFCGDAPSLMHAMEESSASAPNKKFEIKRVIAEGEIVAVHSHVQQDSEDIGGAVVHIFRFDGEQIVELWDIGQAIPKDSPNEYGMF